MNTVTITVNMDEIKCPVCGAGELENPDAPIKDWRFNIRSNKVCMKGKWWSQCMACAGDDRNKGWFAS